MRRLFPVIAIIIIAIIAIFALSSTNNDPNTPLISVTGNDISTVAEDAVEATEDFTTATGNQLEIFLDRLVQPPSSQIMQVILVITGVILLIFGWRVYDFIIILAGAWVGATLASAAVVTTSVVVEVAAILIGGIIGAALAVFVYVIAVFIIGMYVGAILTTALASLFSLTPISPLALLIGAIVGGFILLGLSAELVIFISSLVGAQMLTAGLGLTREWVLIFTVIGLIVQFASTRFYSINLRRPRRRWIRG